MKTGNELRLAAKGVKSEAADCVTRIDTLKKLEIFMDHRTVEVFVNDGERAAAKIFYQEKDGIFEARFSDEEHVGSVEIYEMKGIWD